MSWFNSQPSSAFFSETGQAPTTELWAPTRWAGSYNRDHNWEAFGQAEYSQRNYGEALLPDIEISRRLIAFHESLPPGGSYIEIGVGANLLPLLAAAPLRDQIVVTDVSAANLAYVRQEIADGLSPLWRAWHERLDASRGESQPLEKTLQRLRELCVFEQVSVLDLSDGTYDASSMMFVAESMTGRLDEFTEACQRCVRCVRPGGGFAAALMLESRGLLRGRFSLSGCCGHSH